MDLNRAAYPMRFTPVAADSPDFDYAAFLRDDAMELSGDASASASSPGTLDDAGDKSSGSPSGQSLPSGSGHGGGADLVPASSATHSQSAQTQAQAQAQRQRLERRGHTKSRRGCFNCKRRRIKCQETRPACGHCVKTGLKCEYPALPQIVHQPHHQIPLFSLQDMRFFQHFLHEFLMHAVLGLSASDLMRKDKDPSLLTLAVLHRVKAIRAIKKRLTEISRSSEVMANESNAMVATCFALTFQSVLLEDGMAEFMTFIRGILIVGMQMWMKGISPMFSNMDDDAESVLAPYMEPLPLIQREWVDAAVAGIRGLRPLLHEEVEIEYYDIMMEWAQKLYTSSFEAYKLLRKHYSWWMMLPHDKFRRIIDPTSQVMVLLGAHWVALQQIMAFITECEGTASREISKTQAHQPPGLGSGSGPGGNPPPKDPSEVDPGMLRWLRWLNRQIGPDKRPYNTWPVWVEEQMDRDITFFGKTQ